MGHDEFPKSGCSCDRCSLGRANALNAAMCWRRAAELIAVNEDQFHFALSRMRAALRDAEIVV